MTAILGQNLTPAFAHGEQVLFIVWSLGLAFSGGVPLVFCCRRSVHKLVTFAVLVASLIVSWAVFAARTIAEMLDITPMDLVLRTTAPSILITIGAVLWMRRIERRQDGKAA